MVPERLNEITDLQARLLCDQLREEIVDSVSQTGGHLASSLGVVEATVAVHRVFDLETDRLVFDVGHQCYAHKILTQRGGQMNSLRKLGGLSGFPKPREHRADAFIAGHASNAVSVALGMARARTRNAETYSVLAMLGDGAMTGGLAYEGLSDAGQSGEQLVVILNDNGMSITKNVGGMAQHLAQQRLKPQYLQFKKFYRRATGRTAAGRGESFSSVFGQTLCQLVQEGENLAAITAAMCSGTGLDEFCRRYPQRFFDVGIAEGHAVAMAAGMAKQRLTPVAAIYSTFLQRAYDMLIHDVAIQGLHVVLGVDRAGLSGEDGETHHGMFDVAYLSTVPGMKIYCPASFEELRQMLRYAVCKCRGPVAVRYPKGGEGEFREMCGIEGTAVLRNGRDITIIAYGTMINEALDAARRLEEKGIFTQVLKLNSIVPLDMDAIADGVRQTGRLLVAEECADSGCVGRRIAAELTLRGMNGVRMGLVNLGDRFVQHGTVAELRQLCGIDGASICRKALEVMAGG